MARISIAAWIVGYLLLGAVSTSAVAQTTTIGGVEFKVRSATLAGGGPNMRFIMAVTNRNAGPVGIFLFTRETSMAVDSGLSYPGSSIVSNAGLGKCTYGEDRETCSNQRASMLTTIPPGVTDNVIIEFQGPFSDDARKQGRVAQLADFSGIMYLTSGDGSAGYVPLSFSDINIHNTTK